MARHSWLSESFQASSRQRISDHSAVLEGGVNQCILSDMALQCLNDRSPMRVGENSVEDSIQKWRAWRCPKHRARWMTAQVRRSSATTEGSGSALRVSHLTETPPVEACAEPRPVVKCFVCCQCRVLRIKSVLLVYGRTGPTSRFRCLGWRTKTRLYWFRLQPQVTPDKGCR